MSKAPTPELKRYMDKRIQLLINGNRKIRGILRGFDPFMNLVIDESVQFGENMSDKDVGMIVIRGNSIVTIEALEPLH
ncbi:putative membrane-associated protein [Conidiobolus coronatus NRRL 28638]|uniref:Small nuclear ribonucleoprotein G n=1 Tax=Conidiobolus coronatus (strain ATCC 28846 / CBS 209.66 / NRRL 28638) TaxID=796925 RepID=A0A137PBC0_CONC2|nr:putative membrane-associated protein [Conidiobolus coronatus NRRL 28638]|eukprot:KXN72303.1 putative membrane-associated protein [Conidiobolus coronatus NRRL 28638]